MKIETILFVGITLGASFLVDGLCITMAGPIQSAPEIWSPVLKMRMLIPAFTAIGLMLFRRSQELSRPIIIFFAAYLFATVLPLVLRLAGMNIIGRGAQILFGAIITIYLVSLHLRKKHKASAHKSGLLFQKGLVQFIALLVGYTLLLGISFWLNQASGLSDNGNLSSFKGLLISFPVLLLHIVVYAWIIYFGEEYGWRYYLQIRLCRLFGIRKALLLVGCIWGFWHAPVIAMGYNYPGYPILGIFTMICFCIVMGILFGYAALRTGGIWAPVLLHGVTNTMAPRFLAFFGQPHNSIFSFGLGLYGIAIFAIPASLIFIFLIGRNHSVKV